MYTIPKHRGILAPALAGAITLTIAPALPAATIVLSPGNNIQAAVNGAVDGDEIVLNPGVYEQVFEIVGKRLTVRSVTPEDPAVVAATIIDGVGLDSVIRVVSTGSGPTYIDGLTITGGNGASGGGIYVETSIIAVIRRCVIEGNTASNPGGGLRATQTLMVVEDCIFRDNVVVAAGGDGGGLYFDGISATVERCVFENNFATDSGGGARFDNVDAQVTECVFDGNQAGLNGGAIFIRSGTVLQVDASEFRDNFAESGGAAHVWSDSGTFARFRNSVFHANTANASGGALFNTRTLDVLNCSFEGNTPNVLAGSGTPVQTISNSILWNNGVTPISVPGSTTVTRSIVEGGFAGTGNLDVDPAFVNAAVGALALAAGSPAIDRADTDLYCGPMVDLAGAPRGVDDPDSIDFGESIIGPVVDMGAYEFQPAQPPATCVGDLDGDGLVGISDFLDLLAAWGACP